MRRLLIVSFVAALVAAPALAGEKEGWYVGIEGSSLQSGNSDMTLAVPRNTSGYPGGDAVTLDTGSGAAYKLLVGFRNAKSDCTLSFWSYDNDDDLSTSSTLGFLNSLPLPDFGNDFSNTLDADGSLETSLTDLTWTRPIATNDRSVFNWTLGLRAWSTEQDTRAIYDMSTPGSDIRIMLHNESQGAGLVAGLGAKYTLTDRVWGSTSLRMAFLTGTVDSMTTGDEFGSTYTNGVDADRNFQQTELETRIHFNVVAGLDMFIGYEYKQFDSALEHLTFVDDVQEGSLFNDVKDLTFSGVAIGASYTF